MGWYIYIYKTIRSNHNIISNVHISYNGRIDTYPYSIANSGIPFAWTTICLTDYHTFMNIAIATYLGITVNSDVVCMS